MSLNATAFAIVDYQRMAAVSGQRQRQPRPSWRAPPSAAAIFAAFMTSPRCWRSWAGTEGAVFCSLRFAFAARRGRAADAVHGDVARAALVVGFEFVGLDQLIEPRVPDA